MPEALPEKSVVVRILDDFVSELGTVSLGAGYHINLIPERPTSRIGTIWEHGTALVFAGASTREEDAPKQYDQRVIDITVRVMVVQNDTAELSLDDQIQNVAADVVYALCSTESLRHRDSWAIDTTPGDVSPLAREADANFGYVDCEFQVQYRTAWGNPFSCPFRT